MRLAFVVCGALASVSGGFLYDRRVIAQLRAAGVEVDVFELPWWRYPAQLAQNLRRWPFSARDYQAVIQDELAHPAVFLRNRQLRAQGRPVITLVHNLAGDQPATRVKPLVRACERRYFQGVDGVIAVCADTLARVQACGGAGLPAVVATPGRDHVAAIEPSVIDARSLARELRLGFVGQVAAHKGLHRLVPVLAELRVLDLVVEVAGATSDARYLARVKADLARAGVGDRMRFHGQLAPDALQALLAGCHAFVMPSDREAYPLGALEAMAAGLPVLLTKAGGTAELLGDGDAGCLLAPDDHPAWSDAIAVLATDRPRLRRLSHAARARHLTHGTWADTARTVREFVARLAP